MAVRVLAGLLVFWCSMQLALAGEGPESTAAVPGDDAIEVEGVVVTAERRETLLKETAEIVRVVPAREIRRMNASSTSEVLETVAGVTLESGTGSGYPKRGIVSINGLPAQYVLVLVNGQRLLTDHIHSGQNVDMIPPESIVRIEIVKTAASAQYGSDAIGGVVNIITRPQAGDDGGKVYGSYGSNSTINTGTGVVASPGAGTHVSMFADWETTDGPDILAPAHRIGKLGYDRISLLNSVEMQWHRNLTAQLYFNYFQNRMDWADGEQYSRLLMPKADLHLDLGKHWRVTGTMEYTSWDAAQGAEVNELLHPKLFATWTSWGGRNRLTFGGDYRYNWFIRSGLDSTMTQWGYGIFAQDAVTLSDAWSASASVRMDHFEDLSPVISPKLAVRYRPIRDLTIRLAASRGFHAPTVQERYEQAYGHGGTALRFGNPDLEPETSTAFSLSAEGVPTRSLRLFANGYCYLIDNFIVPRYEGPWSEDPTKNRWVRTNILRAWVYGGELSARWSPWRWLKLHAGYTYGANWDEADDEELQFDPGHTAFGRLEFMVDFAAHGRFSFFTKAVYRAGRSAWNWKPAAEAEPDNEAGYITELEDYVLLDAGAEIRWRNYSAFAKATNLLSQDIEHLDDALTVLDGKPLYKVGLRIEW